MIKVVVKEKLWRQATSATDKNTTAHPGKAALAGLAESRLPNCCQIQRAHPGLQRSIVPVRCVDVPCERIISK